MGDGKTKVPRSRQVIQRSSYKGARYPKFVRGGIFGESSDIVPFCARSLGSFLSPFSAPVCEMRSADSQQRNVSPKMGTGLPELDSEFYVRLAASRGCLKVKRPLSKLAIYSKCFILHSLSFHVALF